MSVEHLRFERGETSLDVVDATYVRLDGREVDGFAGGTVILDVDELRWLVLTVGPAALVALAEADAGGGGGPPPASADGTAATDGQLALDGGASTSEPPLDSPLD